MRTWQIRTLHIATHGDDNIYLRNIGQKLAVLCGFHVNTMNLFHQANGILIDLRLCFRTSRIAFKYIGSQIFSQCFCNLTAAGVMDTDKGNFLQYSFSFALILQIICVMVPIGQKLHQVLGLNRVFTTTPMMVEVSIML